jgi:subtilase family serine protease
MSSSIAASWVQMEANYRPFNPHNPEGAAMFEEEADKHAAHSVSFHLTGLNADVLEKRLQESSNPKSPSYGKHMTRDEVRELTTDFEGLTKVEQFLHDLNEQMVAEGSGEIKVTKKTDSSITAEASIGTWERAFNTTFYRVKHAHGDGTSEMINRARRYFLPEELARHVRTVMGTVQMPVQLSRGPVRIVKKLQADP